MRLVGDRARRRRAGKPGLAAAHGNATSFTASSSWTLFALLCRGAGSVAACRGSTEALLTCGGFVSPPLTSANVAPSAAATTTAASVGFNLDLISSLLDRSRGATIARARYVGAG